MAGEEDKLFGGMGGEESPDSFLFFGKKEQPPPPPEQVKSSPAPEAVRPPPPPAPPVRPAPADDNYTGEEYGRLKEELRKAEKRIEDLENRLLQVTGTIRETADSIINVKLGELEKRISSGLPKEEEIKAAVNSFASAMLKSLMTEAEARLSAQLQKKSSELDLKMNEFSANAEKKRIEIMALVEKNGVELAALTEKNRIELSISLRNDAAMERAEELKKLAISFDRGLAELKNEFGRAKRDFDDTAEFMRKKINTIVEERAPEQLFKNGAELEKLKLELGSAEEKIRFLSDAFTPADHMKMEKLWKAYSSLLSFVSEEMAGFEREMDHVKSKVDVLFNNSNLSREDVYMVGSKIRELGLQKEIFREKMASRITSLKDILGD